MLLITGVVACAATADAASLTVTWNAPTTNVDGSPLQDLAGYRVYLGAALPSCPGGSFLTVSSPTTTPSSGQTISSRVTDLGAGTTYFARVTAVDASGNEGPCSTSASGVAQPDFSVSPSVTTSFGSIASGATVDRTFTVQNTSSGAISGAASIAAPFRIVAGGSFSLAPGATQTVTVRFQPTSAGSFASNANFIANGDTLSRGVSGSATGGATVTLSVTKNGTGTGTVTSVPAGITCGAACTQSVIPGTPVTLSAAATSGSTFVGWGGACSGTTACVVTVSSATSVSATFNTNSTPQPPSAAPGTPGPPSVTQVAADAGGVTFTIAWAAGSGAASYQYAAGFNDGSGFQQGSSSGVLSFQLRMPYHASGAAFGGFVCIRSVNAASVLSADQSCSALSMPVRPPAPPVPTLSSLSPATVQAAGADFTLTVNGSGFVSTSVVRWNGNAKPTTFVSPTQLQAAVSSADLASSGSIPVSVVTPAPGGGTSGTVSFTITAPPSSSPPAAPGSPTVTQLAADAGGVTLAIAWTAASGATSYRYGAAFNDGSGAQQGTVTGTSVQLRMPYHSSGAAFGGFVCVGSIGPSGQQSPDPSCSALQVPARP